MSTYQSFYDYCIENDSNFLLKEWDFDKNEILPTNINFNTAHKFWFKCPCGHSYQASLRHRTQMHTGCPVCAGKKVLLGENNLPNTQSETARQ